MDLMKAVNIPFHLSRYGIEVLDDVQTFYDKVRLK
jgi:hypothetical protein